MTLTRPVRLRADHIDRRNHHNFSRCYQVATAVLSPAEIAAPIRQLEVKQRNLSVVLADVTGVDVASRTIEASSGRKRPQDRVGLVVVATGMCPSYFGHDAFARYPGAKKPSASRDDPSQSPECVRTR